MLEGGEMLPSTPFCQFRKPNAESMSTNRPMTYPESFEWSPAFRYMYICTCQDFDPEPFSLSPLSSSSCVIHFYLTVLTPCDTNQPSLLSHNDKIYAPRPSEHSSSCRDSANPSRRLLQFRRLSPEPRRIHLPIYRLLCRYLQAIWRYDYSSYGW